MSAPSLQQDSDLQVLMRAVETWNKRDLEGYLDCLTDDVYWDDPPMPSPARSKQEVRRWATTALGAFSDFTFELKHVYRGAEHHYAIKWLANATWTGRLDPPGFAPNGRHIQFEGLEAVDFRDGKICRIQTFIDGMRLSMALGVMPRRPAPGSLAEKMSVRVQRVVAWFQRRKTADPSA